MSLYPLNTNVSRRAQTDVAGKYTTLLSTVCYAPGGLAVTDDDRFVVSANMKVGAYTIATAAMPEATVARKLLITVTQVGGVNDTMGTLAIVGTDLAGEALSESIAPAANSTKETVNAFLTVTSITGAGWVRDGAGGTEDTIKIGTSESIGLPDKLGDTAQILFASHNGTKEATAPTITKNSSVLGGNTFNLDTALNGSAVLIYYLV
jgi:hypothetical protein